MGADRQVLSRSHLKEDGAMKWAFPGTGFAKKTIEKRKVKGLNLISYRAKNGLMG
jgi:hypothetical protein